MVWSFSWPRWGSLIGIKGLSMCWTLSRLSLTNLQMQIEIPRKFYSLQKVCIWTLSYVELIRYGHSDNCNTWTGLTFVKLNTRALQKYVVWVDQRAFREELCILLSISNRPICVLCHNFCTNWGSDQRYTHRVLQTIQMKLILLWVWAEQAVLGRAKTALKFKYEI